MAITVGKIPIYSVPEVINLSFLVNAVTTSSELSATKIHGSRQDSVAVSNVWSEKGSRPGQHRKKRWKITMLNGKTHYFNGHFQ